MYAYTQVSIGKRDVAFSVSRTLNCTDRTSDGAFTNDTGSIVITAVDPELIAPLPLQSYTDGSDFVKTLPFNLVC